MTQKTSKPARNGTGSDWNSLAASSRNNTETDSQFQAEIAALRARRLTRRFQLPPATAALMCEHAFGPLDDNWVHLGDAATMAIATLAELMKGGVQ